MISVQQLGFCMHWLLKHLFDAIVVYVLIIVVQGGEQMGRVYFCGTSEAIDCSKISRHCK